MSQIITNLPRYSDGEIDEAFMREIHNGFRMEREKEKDRIASVKRQVSGMRGKTHPTLGRPVASMPARDFFRLTQKYGHKEVHSKEFIKYFQKKMPELSPTAL
tara:strand:+ start:987 stop:1295 length:309 start_codon:yes stop_codon:yes gene_type:complete